MENGRVMGDVIELDYKRHVMELKKNTVPIATVTAKHEDGAELHLPYKEWDGHRERLFHEHGELKSLRREPEDEAALRGVLHDARRRREKEARPAVFKVRVGHAKKPSIKQRIAEGKHKQQLSQSRAAAPERTAAKSKGLEV
jgi:hypothetical protein